MPKTTTKTKNKELVHAAALIVGRWTPRLGLTAWSVTVSTFEDKEDSASMRMGWEPGYRNAALTINTAMVDIDHPIFERLLVHELFHLVYSPVSDWIDQNLLQGGPLCTELAWRMESVVDSCANIAVSLSDLHTD